MGTYIWKEEGGMKLIKYFRDLLLTLKHIENHLKKISDCVHENRSRGDRSTLSVKHWND